MSQESTANDTDLGHAPAVMACMEVWGGNEATERSLSMLGLETWVYSRPYRAAAGGGDVYFVSSCATGRITRLLVADVSGHGAAVSDVATRLRTLLRRHVNHIEQRQFIAEMNREFGQLRHQGGFVTAIAGTFFAPTGRLTVTSAGHPPALAYRGASARWELVVPEESEAVSAEPSDLPLGLLEDMGYGEQKIATRAGDLLLFYTDSLIESKTATGSMLGPQGLLEVVSALDATRPALLIQSLLAALTKLNPENLTDDDVTVLLFRPTGGGKRVPLANRALAPWLFLWGCGKAIASGERLPLPEFTWANFGGSMLDRWSHAERRPPTTSGRQM